MNKSCLHDLFGPPSRWGQTLRPMLWTHASVVTPPFNGENVVDLPVPCTYDFNLAATKYFHALEGGDVPLRLLFSGTIFYGPPMAVMQVAQIPWEREANFSLPVDLWKTMMDMYYPNTAWLNLRKDVFDRLQQSNRQRAGDLGTSDRETPVRSGGGSDSMNRAFVDKIVNALLYEGYILYPYRPSVKSHQRWTFGGLYPRSWSWSGSRPTPGRCRRSSSPRSDATRSCQRPLPSPH